MDLSMHPCCTEYDTKFSLKWDFTSHSKIAQASFALPLLEIPQVPGNVPALSR